MLRAMADTPKPSQAQARSLAPGCVTVTWAEPKGVAGARYEIVALPTKTLYTATGKEREICGLEARASYSFELRTVLDGARSDPVTAGPEEIMRGRISDWWRISSFGLAGLFVVAGFVTLLLHWTPHTRHGVAFACWVVFLGLLLLTLTGGTTACGAP